MKTIETWAWTLATVISTMTITQSALAGKRDAAPVTISSTQAQGGFGSARNSTTDSKQAIGCSLTYTGGTIASVTCSATDAAGHAKSCSAAVPTGVFALHGLTDDSFLLFTWDSSGKCRDIWVSKSSAYEPKNP